MCSQVYLNHHDGREHRGLEGLEPEAAPEEAG
jgi:hypothetical protein